MQSFNLNTLNSSLMQNIMMSKFTKSDDLKFEDKSLSLKDNFSSLVFVAKNTFENKNIETKLVKTKDGLCNVNKDGGSRGQSTFANSDSSTSANSNSNTDTNSNQNKQNPFYNKTCVFEKRNLNNDVVNVNSAMQDALRQKLFMQSVNVVENAKSTLLNAVHNIENDSVEYTLSNLDLLSLAFVTKALSSLKSLNDLYLYTNVNNQRVNVDPTFIPFIYFMFMKVASFKKKALLKKAKKDDVYKKNDNKSEQSHKEALMSFMQ